MYPGNSWYGHRSILCSYCGVSDQQVFGSIQHGYYIKNKNYSKRKLSSLIPFFCWSKRIYLNALKKNLSNKVKIIGSPFLYLDLIKNKNKNKNIRPKRPSGTIFFPAHNYPSSEKKFHKFMNFKFINTVFDHQDYINKIKKISKSPFKVGIYFSDYTKEIEKIYKKNGWKVFVTGNRQDNRSLKKVYNLIKDSKYVITSEPGSTMLYSLYLKKKTRVLFDKKKNIDSSYYKNNMDFIRLNKKISKKIYNNFVNDKSCVDFAKIELGFNHIKSPREMIKIIKVNNYFFKFLSYLMSKMLDMRYKKYRYSS